MALDPGLDLFPLLASVLASVSCGVLGSFLVLRRLSLMGDAISHSVLPGLVIAYIVTSDRSPVAMFVGAALAGVVTVVLVEVVKSLGRVEPGAAMGVVFSVLFALGVLLIERAARQVDLDADCVLHGQLETLAWYGGPLRWGELSLADVWRSAPRQVITLGAVCLASVGLAVVLFKELRVAAFDPQLATTLGYHAGVLHYVLMVFVAGATVASFEAVGSILVIAMLIGPGAVARLLTDRLVSQLWVTAAVAVVASVGGYVSATAVPMAFGADSVNAAGAMTVCVGVLLLVAVLFGPRHGVLVRRWRRRGLANTIARDDALGLLYRAGETGKPEVHAGRLRAVLGNSGWRAARASMLRGGLVRVEGEKVRLTERGTEVGAVLIRRHRLWEHYLVSNAGLASDHVHESAEALEHVGPAPDPGPSVDPHGKSIPKEDSEG